MTAKRPGISLIVASSLVIAACGSDDAPTTGTTPVSSGKTPSYKAAKQACGASPSETLARSLGVSTVDPTTIAEKYAEQKAPVALRRDVEAGCFAGLTK